MYKNNIHQIGGKKIGRGGFSCVVKPHISCSNSKTKKVKTGLISKITKKKTLTQNYIKVNKLLKKIDPQQQYFRHYSKYCSLTKKHISSRQYKDIKVIDTNILDNSTITDLDDFDELHCEIEKGTSYLNIIETYGGYNLYKILQYKQLNIKPKLHMIVTNLIKGLKLMHDNNIVHRDIKIDNITINNNYHATYIDFNTSVITPLIKKISVIGNYSYNISVDYMIFYYLYRFIVIGNYKLNKKLVYHISKLCNKNIRNSIKTLTDINISYTSLITFNNNDKNIIKTSKNVKHVKHTKTNAVVAKHSDKTSTVLKDKLDNIKFDNLIRLVYKKFSSLDKPLEYFKTELVYKNDIYGLGIIFKVIYNKLLAANNTITTDTITTDKLNSKSTKSNSFNIVKFEELINHMTNINPDKRFTADEVYDFWMK
jgi:serine/threonine protein kinase